MENIYNKKNFLESDNKPDTLINTEKLFNVKCPFSVPAFSKKK